MLRFITPPPVNSQAAIHAELIRGDNSLVKDRLTNIESAAREDANFEKILKFKKGEFSIQEDTIPLGTEFLAHAAAWTKCWIKFADGKVAFARRPSRPANGRRNVSRRSPAAIAGYSKTMTTLAARRH